MSRDISVPTPDALQQLSDIIFPGSVFLAIHSLEGDFSNSTHLVDVRLSDSSIVHIVTRRYAVYGDYDRGEKARREFATLQLLSRHGMLVPEPLYLDDSGTILGTPGIVTRYLSGKLILSQPYPTEWAAKLAKTLAGIHSIPIEVSKAPFLLDANREALWFFGTNNVIPDYVSAHPQGTAVWQVLLDYRSKIIKVFPSLVHICQRQLDLPMATIRSAHG